MVGLAGIVVVAASVVLEETGGAPAFLLERIGAVVALVETFHQALALRAVDVEVENARRPGAESGRESPSRRR